MHGLLPGWAQRKLIEAASIRDDMQRRIEIERITAAARAERPDLFREVSEYGDDPSSRGE